MTPRTRHNAFTLVELLVVIGIIAVLISILLPALSKARESAKALQGLSNIKQLSIATRMYAADNSDWLPAGDNPTHWGIPWPHALAHYLGMPNKTTTQINANPPKVLRCPNAAVPDRGVTHYSANPILIPDLTRGIPSSGSPPWLRPYKLSRARPPAELMLYFDGQQIEAKGFIPYYSAWQINNGLYNQTASLIYRENWFTGTRTNTVLAYGNSMNRDHYGTANFGTAEIRYRQLRDTAANVVFVDGHAETMKRGTIRQSNLRPTMFNNMRQARPTATDPN
jgi:prepilin-type N-terminal cleavage/methylation domain-containing protein/prepilin-type processing-associated H-X9-DG protein